MLDSCPKAIKIWPDIVSKDYEQLCKDNGKLNELLVRDKSEIV
jgi:hypothetical protein